jgi:hypothetical protein
VLVMDISDKLKVAELVLSVFTSTFLALCVALFLQGRAQKTADEGRRWAVLHDMYHAWNDVEIHLIKLDMVICAGVNEELFSPPDNLSRMLENCHQACALPSGQPTDEELWRSKVRVNQYWEDVVYHLCDDKWLQASEDQKEWFRRRAWYFMSILEPLNYVWHYKHKRSTRDDRHFKIDGLFGWTTDNEDQSAYAQFRREYISNCRRKYVFKYPPRAAW